jgi:hypothetical protein
MSMAWPEHHVNTMARACQIHHGTTMPTQWQDQITINQSIIIITISN